MHGAHCRNRVEIALEFVEMPVCGAIDIGRNGTAHIVTPSVCKKLRCIIQHQRRAIGRADDDAAMTAAAVGDSDGERAGELTRFSAELQIPPARIRREPGNANAFDDLDGCNDYGC